MNFHIVSDEKIYNFDPDQLFLVWHWITVWVFFPSIEFHKRDFKQGSEKGDTKKFYKDGIQCKNSGICLFSKLR